MRSWGGTMWVALLGAAGCFDALGTFEAASGGAAQAGGEHGDVDPVLAQTGGAPQQGGAPAEDCTNGRDDDGNGLVDCEDTAGCASFLCVAIEPGWLGPIVLQRPGDDTPCESPYADVGPSGLLLASAQNPCGCSCGAATGQACEASVTAYSDDACSGTSVTSTIGPNPVCGAFAGTGGSAKMKITTTGGTCAASAAASVVGEEITSCGSAPGAGCHDGSGCVRPPVPGREICLYQRGDVEDCPGPFIERKLLLSNPGDLACSASADCDCDAPNDGSCAGSVTIQSAGCGSSVVGTVDEPATCAIFSTAGAFGAATVSATATGGSCKAVGLTPPSRFGDVTTLCCAPSI